MNEIVVITKRQRSGAANSSSPPLRLRKKTTVEVVSIDQASTAREIPFLVEEAVRSSLRFAPYPLEGIRYSKQRGMHEVGGFSVTVVSPALMATTHIVGLVAVFAAPTKVAQIEKLRLYRAEDREPLRTVKFFEV